MAELALRFRLDLVQQAWEGFQAGLFAREVGERIGVNRTTAKRMLVAAAAADAPNRVLKSFCFPRHRQLDQELRRHPSVADLS